MVLFENEVTLIVYVQNDGQRENEHGSGKTQSQ
jgi:hypothetical protein